MVDHNPQGWTHHATDSTWSFFHAKLDAKRLPYAELVAFARVSTDNRHKCSECFCCACLEVLREKSRVT